MNRRQFVSAALTLPVLAMVNGCSTEEPYRGPTVVGQWIDAKPLPPEQTIVFDFLPDGSATTTKDAPWASESWSLTVDTITLSGTYLKNGIRQPFKSTYNLRELTLNTLLLEQNGKFLRFIRP